MEQTTEAITKNYTHLHKWVIDNATSTANIYLVTDKKGNQAAYFYSGYHHLHITGEGFKYKWSVITINHPVNPFVK